MILPVPQEGEEFLDQLSDYQRLDNSSAIA
jgi:hypothetical protein